MDLILLKGFVTLAEELHFGRAAARLRIGSPALSKRVAQLEAEWGVPLFDRTSRTVRLTPAGQVLLGPARDLIGEARALGELAAEAAAGAVGLVRAGYIPGTGEIMMFLARELQRRRPDLVVHAEPMSHPRAFAAVEAGAVDCAVVRLPPGPGARSLTLVEHQVDVIALPRDHRLAGGDEVTLADLAGETILVVPPWIPEQRELPLKLQEVEPPSGEVGLFDLVAGGAGLLLVTKGAAYRNPRHEVVTRPLLGLSAVTRDLLVWRADETSPAVRSVHELASELRPEFARVAG